FTSWPFTETTPLTRASEPWCSPRTARSVTLLPEPDSRRTPRTPPASSEKETSCTARTVPPRVSNATLRSRTVSRAMRAVPRVPAIIAGLPIERHSGRAEIMQPRSPAHEARSAGGCPQMDRRNVLLSPSRSARGAAHADEDTVPSGPHATVAPRGLCPPAGDARAGLRAVEPVPALRGGGELVLPGGLGERTRAGAAGRPAPHR